MLSPACLKSLYRWSGATSQIVEDYVDVDEKSRDGGSFSRTRVAGWVSGSCALLWLKKHTAV
jgi:hypothetical protein